jgi:hypothetical protein
MDTNLDLDTALNGGLFLVPRNVARTTTSIRHGPIASLKSVSFSHANLCYADFTNFLLQRVAEMRATLDLATALDSGLVSTSENVAGTTSFDPAWFKGKLDLSRVSAAGHSFGAATAVTTCGLDERFKACVALDCWWEPFSEVRITFPLLYFGVCSYIFHFPSAFVFPFSAVSSVLSLLSFLSSVFLFQFLDMVVKSSSQKGNMGCVKPRPPRI